MNAIGRPAFMRGPSSVEAPDSDLTPEGLARAHAAVVYRFCAMVCPNRQDAEDLAQDALLRVMRNLHRFDPGRGGIEAWLWRIVVNLAHDRGRAARRAESFWQRLAAAEQPLAEVPSAEFEALDRIRDAELVAAVRKLQPRQRTLIALRYGADRSYAEIGALLGLGEQAVKQATYRALGALRRQLEAAR